MKKDELNEWILARKAEGLWVQPCASFCGVWFAQKRMGRRSVVCEKHRCHLWRVYQRLNNQGPPAWLLEKWKQEHGDIPRKRYAAPKRHAEPQKMVLP